MYADLQIWLNHFEYHAHKPRPLRGDLAAALTPAERRAIGTSLAGFQLGEQSDGARLLRKARQFAQRHALAQLPPIIELLIAEEQRHAALLGEFLDAHALGRRRGDLLASLFRRLRRLGGFEMTLGVLLCAELVGIVYYRALENATRCRQLQALCRTLLTDEHAHVGFESALLLASQARCSPMLAWARRHAHRGLFVGTALAAWFGHARVLRRAGYGLWSFLRACRAQYDFYLAPAARLGEVLRRRAHARAQVANSCSAMLRKDLNSSALPEGSSRNMVACSPGAPWKRT